MNIRQESHLELAEVLPLYEAVGWTNYSRNPAMLEQAFKQTLFVLTARDQGKLVGLLRAVGDGASILFIQDIIVLPDYQRQGIGRRLMQETLEHFSHVYQIHLLTDQTQKTPEFYTSVGFSDVETIRCRAFTLVEKK
ncbi:N-acetyltransferase [Streptococcus sp. X16XC17]|uniref:GNAT family N-acetyltransferase n=1 Tax=unclassified Streptococcus TaxID=2608887 RepID=UPI00066FB775|nr:MULTISPECIES: GNAT family N-acetyltransferase [unclassified Streptococcus]TCD46675.1 N-acetyltransferase [Streptococcus sp. X16XC17]